MSRNIILKLTFPQKEQFSSFDNFNFFLFEDSREIQKFTDLAKLLILKQIDIFQFLSRFYMYPWDVHSSKNNSGVSRSSFLINKKIPSHMHFEFSKLKVLFWPLKKKSITIKTNVKIPRLLPSILGLSTKSARPMQIYMNVGV